MITLECSLDMFAIDRSERILGHFSQKQPIQVLIHLDDIVCKVRAK